MTVSISDAFCYGIIFASTVYIIAYGAGRIWRRWRG
ncbi:MAG: hypothetical protein RLZZ475_2540 [Pseudomonadota bacterium]|jgi:hypothetical protein